MNVHLGVGRICWNAMLASYGFVDNCKVCRSWSASWTHIAAIKYRECNAWSTIQCSFHFLSDMFPLSPGQEWRTGQGKQWSPVQLPWFQCTVLAAVVWYWGWLHACFKSSAIWGSKGAETAFQNRSHRNAILPCECFATCPSAEGVANYNGFYRYSC